MNRLALAMMMLAMEPSDYKPFPENMTPDYSVKPFIPHGPESKRKLKRRKGKKGHLYEKQKIDDVE